MNKKLFLIPVLGVAMASCSNHDLADEPNGFAGETETHYLAVNIFDTSDFGTRATNNTNADYENGTADENEVKSIRFYMFDGDGNKFTDASTSQCYVDCTAEPILNSESAPNIEKKLEAVIVFQTEKADDAATPAKLVAVLNPPTGLTTTPANIAALQNSVADYCTQYKTSGSFIMSNSVYAVAGNPATEHVAYDVTSTNIKDSRTDALNNPVEMYVERVVAKARVGVVTEGENKLTPATVTGHNNVYQLSGITNDKIYDSNNQEVTQNIYVELLGWNVTATAAKSRLVKKINPAWGGTGFTSDKFAWGTSNEWNKADYSRSFWAVNPEGFSASDIQYGNFNGTSDKSNSDIPNVNPANACTDFTKATPVYMQENASWDATSLSGSDPTTPTKLIVAAKLIDGSGNAVKLGWFEGTYYLQDDLKKVVLNKAKIFKKTSSGTSDTYSPVTTEIGIKFITTTAAGDFNADGTRADGVGVSSSSNRYNSYAQTTETSITEGTYYVKNGDGSYTEIKTINDLNGYLKGAGLLKVWEEGLTYYWLDITHLAPTAELYGYKGIVRNHIYDFALTNIKGFGIPVTDPNETIYPEEPNDPEMMYISAKINILSWRLVNHDNTELGW